MTEKLEDLEKDLEDLKSMYEESYEPLERRTRDVAAEGDHQVRI